MSELNPISPSVQPLVSIICPCYNAGACLARTIESVLAQSYKHVEFLLMDGGSTDETTLSIMRRYAPLITICSEPDKGIYDAMNKGIERAKGEWLYFIGADDCLHDKQVLEQVFATNDWRGYDVVMGPCFFGKTHRHYALTRRILLENTVLHQAAFYAKHVFDDYRYDCAYSTSADYDLNFYCYRHYPKVGYVPTTIADYSLEGLSSQVHFRSYGEELAIRRKYIASRPLRLLLSLYTYARYGARKLLSLLHLRHIA